MYKAGLLALISGVFSSSLIFAGTEITLPAQAEVSAGYIRLGEIAQLQGDRNQPLEKLFLGKSPAQGEQAVISRDWIMRRIKAAGLEQDISISGALEVTIKAVAKAPEEKPAAAEAAAVSTATADNNTPAISDTGSTQAASPLPAAAAPVVAQKALRKSSAARKAADSDAIAQPAAAKTAEQTQDERDQTNKLHITRAVKEYVNAAKGISDAEVVCTVRYYKFTVEDFFAVKVDGLSRGEIGGKAQLSLLTTDSEGKISGFGEADVNISVSVNASVLVRNLRKGEEVRKGDVEIRKIRYKQDMPLEAVTSDELTGKVAGKNLRAGEAICAGDFAPALDVVKGKPLTLIATRSGFQIKEMVTALADGRKGDFIDVQSVVANTVYTARVTGPGTADVALKK